MFAIYSFYPIITTSINVIWRIGILFCITCIESILVSEPSFAKAALALLLFVIQLSEMYARELASRFRFNHAREKLQNLKQLVDIMNYKLSCGVIIF